MKKIATLLLLAGLFAGCHSFYHEHEHGYHSAFEVKQYNGEPVPWTHLQANNDPGNFQFVLVGDRTGGIRQGVFSNAMHQVNLMQPEFVLSVGDLIRGNRNTSSAEAIDSMWKEFDGFVRTLDMPFFYVSGNHDFYNPLLSDKWTERLGPSYYAFVYKDVQFIVLNSQFTINEKNQWPGRHEAQMDFLQETLAEKQDARWTVVVFHHPLWSYKEKEAFPEIFHDCYDRWLEMEALLNGRKYTVFAGHTHHYNKEERNGREFITLATTGAGSKLRGIEYGEFDHFLWVTMTDDGPVIANLMLDGVLDADRIPTLPPKP